MEEYSRRFLPKGRNGKIPRIWMKCLLSMLLGLKMGQSFQNLMGSSSLWKRASYFCPALAKAVKTMKKGEKAFLTVKPQYAFGESGRPASGVEGVVPPNSSLQIELELVSWKSVSDITEDRKVLKKTLKEGEGYERPNDGAVVQVKLIGKLQDGSVFLRKGHDDEQPFEFKIDEEQVIDGLDRAVKNMKKGEVALLTIQPEYAFGPSGSTQELGTVPPNSTVYYEVELVSFVKGHWLCFQ